LSKGGQPQRLSEGVGEKETISRVAQENRPIVDASNEAALFSTEVLIMEKDVATVIPLRECEVGEKIINKKEGTLSQHKGFKSKKSTDLRRGGWLLCGEKNETSSRERKKKGKNCTPCWVMPSQTAIEKACFISWSGRRMERGSSNVEGDLSHKRAKQEGGGDLLLARN